MANNLTTKELGAIEDTLKQEEILVKKFEDYSSRVTDPKLKKQCKDIAQRHQGHIERLVSLLG